MWAPEGAHLSLVAYTGSLPADLADHGLTNQSPVFHVGPAELGLYLGQLPTWFPTPVVSDR